MGILIPDFWTKFVLGGLWKEIDLIIKNIWLTTILTYELRCIFISKRALAVHKFMALLSKNWFFSFFFQWHQFQRRGISTRWFLLIISSFYCFTFFWPSREFLHLKKSMTCTPLIFNLIQKNLGTWKLSITFSAYFQSLHCQQIFQLLP